MIKITDTISIDENNIQESFILSDGPGGQHVNKNATAVRLTFNAIESKNLPEYVKNRLRKIAGNSLTSDGRLIIVSKNHRSQYRNRLDAYDRLIRLIKKAAHRPKRRRKTKPTKASQEKRLQSKKKRAQLKKQRSFNKRDF